MRVVALVARLRPPSVGLKVGTLTASRLSVGVTDVDPTSQRVLTSLLVSVLVGIMLWVALSSERLSTTSPLRLSTSPLLRDKEVVPPLTANTLQLLAPVWAAYPLRVPAVRPNLQADGRDAGTLACYRSLGKSVQVDTVALPDVAKRKPYVTTPDAE